MSIATGWCVRAGIRKMRNCRALSRALIRDEKGSGSHLWGREMKYLLNTALGAIFLVSAFCLSAIYGNGLPGIAILMAFTFCGILIVIVVNSSK